MPMGRGITERCVKTCIELGVPVVTTGRADPGEKAVHDLKGAGIKVVSVIPTVEHARRMEAEGVDAVVASGSEAGGHVGSVATLPLVPQVVDAVKIPVIAAGGIGDGRGFLAAFALGRRRHPDGHAVHGRDRIRSQCLGRRATAWACARRIRSSPAP